MSNEVTKNKNVNLCEEPEEDPKVFDPGDHGVNLVEDFTFEDDFGRILLEEDDQDKEEDMVCNVTKPNVKVYQHKNKDQNTTPFIDHRLN